MRFLSMTGFPMELALKLSRFRRSLLPQTFLLGPINNLPCRDYQPQAGANAASCPVLSARWRGPQVSCLPGTSQMGHPMRWPPIELLSRFSMITLILRQRLPLANSPPTKAYMP